MIFRGIGLPAGSLRWPDSMRCEIRVLIWMMSPFLASLGSLMRGLSAISSLLLPAAAADGHLDRLALGEQRAIAHLRHRDHVLGLRQADADRCLGLAAG